MLNQCGQAIIGRRRNGFQKMMYRDVWKAISEFHCNFACKPAIPVGNFVANLHSYTL